MRLCLHSRNNFSNDTSYQTPCIYETFFYEKSCKIIIKNLLQKQKFVLIFYISLLIVSVGTNFD